jgi:hypothetical protein
VYYDSIEHEENLLMADEACRCEMEQLNYQEELPRRPDVFDGRTFRVMCPDAVFDIPV